MDDKKADETERVTWDHVSDLLCEVIDATAGLEDAGYETKDLRTQLDAFKVLGAVAQLAHGVAKLRRQYEGERP